MLVDKGTGMGARHVTGLGGRGACWCGSARSGGGLVGIRAGPERGRTDRARVEKLGEVEEAVRQWLTAVDVSVGSAPPGLCTGRDPRHAN